MPLGTIFGRAFFDGNPVAEGASSERTSGHYALFGKRLVDVAGSAALLLLLAPLIAALVALVWLDGGRPLFTHRRIGRHGHPFGCLKIRTMRPDAEATLARLLCEDSGLAEEWRRDFKLERDPRVTPIGRLLRRTSLDELPQLWNVLRGDMSLVGPRPVTEDELARYGPHLAGYLSVRPGLTGPWQVSGRNALCWSRRASLDAEYARAPSLARDLALLLRTVGVVVAGTGR